MLPEAVLYDVNLTLTLPASMSATSGLNAIAHAVEGLYARDGNPIVSLMAEEGVRALAQALPRIVDRPGDIEARSDALYGAWLCALMVALDRAIETMDVVPFDAAAAPDAMARLSRALGVAQDPAGALFDLGVRLGAPAGLKALGMSQVDLDRAADLAVENPYWNPRPIERPAIRRLLQAAFDGDRPA